MAKTQEGRGGSAKRKMIGVRVTAGELRLLKRLQRSRGLPAVAHVLHPGLERALEDARRLESPPGETSQAPAA